MRIKQADGKKQKNCMTILSETFRDFAKNSSIHGLKYIVREETKPWEKLFWLLVVLSGICGAVYMTKLFWDRYTSNPTRTTILTSFAPTTIIPFPAVTLCNINRIMAHKLDHFVEELNLKGSDADLVKRTLPQLLAFTNPTSTLFNITELQILQEILEENEITDTNYVMKKITQSCHELLVKCFWNYKEEECDQLFKETLTIDGYCCSFNYVERNQETVYHTSLNGPTTGLYLILDTMSQAIRYTKHNSKGLQVMLHTPQDYPGEDAIVRMAKTGSQTDLQIFGTKLKCSKGVSSLSIEQRQCVFPGEVDPLFFHEKYADTNCLTECNAKYFIESCKCVPFYFNFSDLKICNMTEIGCLANATKEKNLELSRSKCYCPPECEDYDYDVLLTSTQIELTDSIENPFISRNMVTSDTTIVNVYFVSNAQKVLLRDTITSTIYLLSSFGGVYSLFIGCSIITLVEIIYFFVVRSIVNIKVFDRVDNPDMENRNVKIREKNEEYYLHHGRNVFLN